MDPAFEMSSTNGVLSPPVLHHIADAATTPSSKRKRDESVDPDPQVNGLDNASNTKPTQPLSDKARGDIRDLIDVLKSHDTTPSILTRSIPDRPLSAEPHAKRQKADESISPNSAPSTTILSKHAANLYRSLDEVLCDIDTAVFTIKDMLLPSGGNLRHQHIPESEISLKVTAFKERAHTMVDREKTTAGRSAIILKHNSGGMDVEGGLGNGKSRKVSASSDLGRTVLTLYGNAPGPKQLFSSYQAPTRLDGEGEKVRQSLEKAGLPNGITTTQIVPAQTTGLLAANKKRILTLGELFPSSNIPRLEPPKPSKHSTTRSLSVGWYQPGILQSSKSAGYFKQTISSGQWIDYANASQPHDTKRRHRDRTLSLGGSKMPPNLEEGPELEAAKLEALFRSAYSGFAPTRDDSAAVVPEAELNRLWWQRVGDKEYRRHITNFLNFDEVINPDEAPADTSNELDLKQLYEMAEELEQSTSDQNHAFGTVVEKSAEEKDVEEVLSGISELLETLNSYQRIRHSSLNSASVRPVGLLSTVDSSSQGTPSKPSDSEQATYEMLRASLEVMIATLPPYAVAKLDSDRLSELSISTKIEVQQDDHNGVMEEDETSARAKAALSAASAARAATTAPLHRSGSSQLYGNQYGGSRPSSTQQYYGGSAHQTPIRPPSTQRPPATAPAPYQPQRNLSTPNLYRPQYGNPAYPQQGVRPAQPIYQPTNNQQYSQTAGSQNYMRSQSQNYQQQTPQAAPSPIGAGYPRQPSYPQHVQTPQSAVNNYQYASNMNLHRQASPQKHYSSQSQPGPALARPYGTSTPTPLAAPRVPSYLQNTLNQASSNPISQLPQPAQPAQQAYARQNTQYTSSYMTQQQQSNLLERQREYLTNQPEKQQQARNAAQQNMASPSKTQVNGNPLPAGL